VRQILGDELKSSQGELHLLAREVTTRKQELQTALDSMRVAREHAERASETKGNFLSLISHELRTPLATLQLSLHALRRGPTAYTERQEEALLKIERSMNRLLELIESVLEYTRVESGRLAMCVETIDVRALALEVADEVRAKAQGKQLRLEVTAERNLPALTSDRRLLRLVLVHLLANGIRHTSEGRVTLRVREEGGAHLFEVRDTGPGISGDERLRIFEPFGVLSPMAHKHQPGLGLGLPLVRRVVQALGGDLELESVPGSGSLFRVRLPPLVETARPSAA
jgi:signal transduction histidine kinase